MAINETSQPTAETRDEISPVSDAPAVNRENSTAPTATQQPQQPLNGNAPPIGNQTAQPTTTARQQPVPQPPFQYQLPYAPYPYQPYTYPPPVRVLPQYSKPWTVSKLILTIFLIVIAIIILALACVFVGEEGDAQWSAAYALPITILSILWNGAELITFAVRSRKDVKRGIHPGAHVGLHLCFWIACVFAVLVSVGLAISVQSIINDCAEMVNSRYTYYSYCDDYGYQNSEYMNGMYLPMLRAMTALFCMMTAVHFVLFVVACIDTHKRNLLRPAGIVMPAVPPAGVYYPPPPPGVPGVAPYPYAMPVPPMPPQQVHYAPQPNVPGVVEQKTQMQTQMQTHPNPAAQNYQNLAGFYAPAASQLPPRASHSPTRTAGSSSNEKAVASTSAQPGQAS
ncbi:hypothetical protein F4776DRAFT_19816 [Hypoxylon sp. NC0597]|nr:hypothetical protein F4776DRAFT_19816 [Hypoxylon sp. NC0597]